MQRESGINSQQETKRPAIGELRDVAMFEGLDDRVLGRLAAIAEWHVFEAGHRLFAQGDVDAPFCLLISGQISSLDRKSTRLNSSHYALSRMPSSA